MITAQQFMKLLPVPAGESASLYLEADLPVGSLQSPKVVLANTTGQALSYALEFQLNFGDTGTDGMTGNHTFPLVGNGSLEDGDTAGLALNTAALIPYVLLTSPMRHKLTVTNESDEDVILPVLYTGWTDRPTTRVVDFRAIEEE